jgi:DNA-binding MarR family transcriptional regulator
MDLTDKHPTAQTVEIAAGITAMLGLLLQLRPRDTSLTTDFVLAHLQRAGPQRLTELAQAAGVSQPTMTELIARLTRAGMVERRRQPDDRRVVLVAATDVGIEAARRRRALLTERLSALVAGLSPTEIDVLGAAVGALRHTAELGGWPPL